MINIINESKWPIISNLEDLKRLPGGLYLCPECRSFTYYRNDHHRAENICENCGEVINDKMMVSQNPVTKNDYVEILVDEEHLTEYFQSKNTPKDGRIKWLETHYSETHADKQGWRLRQYHDYIGVVNTHFQMTTYQKDRVWFLVQQTGDLKKFHRTCTYEQIILALCIGIMRKDKREISFKKRLPRRAFKFVDEVCLDEENYLKIMEKMAFTKIPV